MSGSEWMNEWENALGGFTDGLVDDDVIKGMDEVKLSTRLTKTKEEIERYTIDEQMDDAQKTLFLLKNGAEIQKISALSHITVVKRFSSGQKNKIVQMILDQMQQGERGFEFTLSCARIFCELVDEGVVETSTIDCALPSLRKLLESKDPEVQAVWADAMIVAIRHMSLQLLETEILPEAIVNSGLSQPVALRLWSCRVFGALASRMEVKRIESTFFKKAMALCQDTDYEVRSCMCKQLNAIAKAVGTELTKTVVLEEYTELLNDEEARVKQAALANLVLLFEVPLPEPTKVQQLHLPNLNTIPSAQRQMILWTSSSATAATKAASMAALPSFESPSTARRLSMLSGQGTSNTYGTQNTQTASAYGNAPRKSSLTAMSLNKLSGSNVSQSANVLPGAGSDIHGVLDIETKLTVVIPTWKKLCHEKSPALLPNLCEEFGKFMWCMKDIIKDEDVEWFITWYLKMAVSKDIVIRDMCSYNLPGICKFLAIITPEPHLPSNHAQLQSTARDAACSALSNNRLFPCILNIIEQHSTDESAIVRKRLAAGLHEIAVLLEMDAYRYVRVAWNRLLLDEDLDVFTTLIRSADTILCCFTRDQRWNPLDADFNQMLVMILRKHNQLVRENKKYKWRQIADVIGQFRNFCIYFDGEIVISQVVPVLLDIIVDTHSATITTPLREAAIESLVWYSRYLPRLEQRERIWNTVKEHLTDVDKTVYKQRLGFVYFLRRVLDVCSARFFKENFVMEYLDLGHDPVCNIRLKMVELLPVVRKCLKLPNDSQQMQKLNDVVAHLVMQEDDNGVSKLLNTIVENMTNHSRDAQSQAQKVVATKVPSAASVKPTVVINAVSTAMPVASQSPGVVADSVNAATDDRTAWDIQDAAKEAEEERMLLREAEMDEHRKKRDGEELRQDFSKRLERSAAVNVMAGMDKLALKDKVTRTIATPSREMSSSGSIGVGTSGNVLASLKPKIVVRKIGSTAAPPPSSLPANYQAMSAGSANKSTLVASASLPRTGSMSKFAQNASASLPRAVSASKSHRGMESPKIMAKGSLSTVSDSTRNSITPPGSSGNALSKPSALGKTAISELAPANARGSGSSLEKITAGSRFTTKTAASTPTASSFISGGVSPSASLMASYTTGPTTSSIVRAAGSGTPSSTGSTLSSSTMSTVPTTQPFTGSSAISMVGSSSYGGASSIPRGLSAASPNPTAGVASTINASNTLHASFKRLT